MSVKVTPHTPFFSTTSFSLTFVFLTVYVIQERYTERSESCCGLIKGVGSDVHGPTMCHLDIASHTPKCTATFGVHCIRYVRRSWTALPRTVAFRFCMSVGILSPILQTILSRPGIGNLRHACQAWQAERFSVAHWVNWNTVIMISQKIEFLIQ
jgi:hypothetical protein